MRRLFVDRTRRELRLASILSLAWLAGAFALTLALDSPNEPGAVIYVPAVAVLALEFGTVTGLLAGLLATALYVAATTIKVDAPDLANVLYRAVPFLVVGGLVGWLGNRLRTAEQAHERLLETANEGIWLIDRDSRTTFVNRRLSELLGYEPEELQGGPVSAVASLRELEQPGAREVALRRRDGSVVQTFVRSSLVRTGNGELMGTLAMVTDVSALRDAEEQLRAARLARRQATELNDNVVQGLALAVYALRRGDQDEAERLIDGTLGEARRMISDLVGAVTVEPGDLRRETPAGA